jgi:hypothetical protein
MITKSTENLIKKYLENNILEYDIEEEFSKLTINKIKDIYYINFVNLKIGKQINFTLSEVDIIKLKRML